jgi:hypothetical protein
VKDVQRYQIPPRPALAQLETVPAEAELAADPDFFKHRDRALYEQTIGPLGEEERDAIQGNFYRDMAQMQGEQRVSVRVDDASHCLEALLGTAKLLARQKVAQLNGGLDRTEL